MIKILTTEKEIKRQGGAIAAFGYCEVQALLSFSEPCAYTRGIDGWNADVYDFNGVTIVTGYRPFGKRYLDFEVSKKYEKEAEKIRFNSDLSDYEKTKKKISRLLEKFIGEIRAVAVNA